MSEFDIKLYAESCVRADHPHDLKNFKEIFERGEYCRRRYLGNNHLDFGTDVFQKYVTVPASVIDFSTHGACRDYQIYDTTYP